MTSARALSELPPYPPGALSPRGTVSPGARRGWGGVRLGPGRAGRSPTPLVSLERSRRRARVLGAGTWAPAPHLARGPLTSRHAGAHHWAAGPGRCASGASGRRALMSPRVGGSARSGAAGGRWASRGAGKGLRFRALSRRRRRRPVVPAAAAASRAAPAPAPAPASRGQLGGRGGPGDSAPRGQRAPSPERSAQRASPPPPRPCAAASPAHLLRQPRRGAGVRGTGGDREGQGHGEGNFWPSGLPRHLVTEAEGQGRGRWGRGDSGV